MEMARVILFTSQMEAMSRFYGEVLGLRQGCHWHASQRWWHGA